MTVSKGIRELIPFMRRVRLQPKIFIYFTTLVVLILFFVSAAVFYFQKQMLARQAQEKAFSLTETLAYTSLNAILLNDYSTLQLLIDSMIGSPDVKVIAILDTSGRVIAADIPEMRGQLYTDSLTVRALASETVIMQNGLQADGTEIWDTAVPIYRLEQRIATARIRYSVEDTYAGLFNTILGIGLLAILVSLVFSYTLARSISRPIKQAADLANAYGQGNLEATVELEREDEIGHLVTSLNKLSADLKKMIEDKISNESLIMIGEFAAYIIHDLKNPLSGIHLLADGLHRRLEDSNPLRKYSTEILLATQKLEDFIGRTLDIARWTKITKKPLQLHELIEEEIRAIQYKSIPIQRRYDPVITQIEGDYQLLSMAIRNLLTNASEAIVHDGTISVETKRVGQETLITIADTGMGMDAERMSKIFRPFFSMKEKGHGLGLAMVKKAVILHQGHIEVQSEKGVGSQFTIRLPDLH
jgi:signal transduction histidine kinase